MLILNMMNGMNLNNYEFYLKFNIKLNNKFFKYFICLWEAISHSIALAIASKSKNPVKN